MLFLMKQQLTFDATDSAHGCEHGGLHLDVPDPGLVGTPQVLLLFLSGEGT